MTPSATVDLPQPDSPTSPMASPGMTVQEKSITAGISPFRVKNEMFRFSISQNRASGRMRSWPQSFNDSSRSASAKQIEAEHQRHQRDRRGNALPTDKAATAQSAIRP